MNSKNSKTLDLHRVLLNLADKIDFKKSDRFVVLSNLSIYYTWNHKFQLPGGSHSVADIQDYFEYILKKHTEKIDNPSIRIYVNKIENRITFKIKTGCYL